MNKTSGAIKPDFFNNLSSLTKDRDEDRVSITDEEKHLYSLSKHKGWTILSRYIDTLLGELDSINRKAIDNGLPLEEIGRNTIVVSLAKDIIVRFVNKIDDAREACERPDGTEK
jgi:hypothetical protein